MGNNNSSALEDLQRRYDQLSTERKREVEKLLDKNEFLYVENGKLQKHAEKLVDENKELRTEIMQLGFKFQLAIEAQSKIQEDNQAQNRELMKMFAEQQKLNHEEKEKIREETQAQHHSEKQQLMTLFAEQQSKIMKQNHQEKLEMMFMFKKMLIGDRKNRLRRRHEKSQDAGKKTNISSDSGEGISAGTNEKQKDDGHSDDGEDAGSSDTDEVLSISELLDEIEQKSFN